jgi:hypothetical protein
MIVDIGLSGKFVATGPRVRVKQPDSRGIPGFFLAIFSPVKGMGIGEVLIAPRSPWQNPICERLIGFIRRECLEHMIILDEDHLRQVLKSCIQYHHKAGTHLSPQRNSPVPRATEPPSRGTVILLPQVGGLHHRYARAA